MQHRSASATGVGRPLSILHSIRIRSPNCLMVTLLMVPITAELALITNPGMRAYGQVLIPLTAIRFGIKTVAAPPLLMFIHQLSVLLMDRHHQNISVPSPTHFLIKVLALTSSSILITATSSEMVGASIPS